MLLINMFDNIIGLNSFLIVILIFLFLAKRYPYLAKIIYVALTIRILFVFFHYNVAPLPDSIGDAANFEIKAYKWSKDGFLNTIANYPGPSSYFISWIIAILYSIFDRSELMALSLSLLFGMGSIILACSIAAKLWSKEIAVRVGWVAALFPALILYSCLVLREVYVCFFLLVAINGCVDWIRNKNIKSLILIIAGFVCATYFHGAMFIGLIIFFLIIFFENIKIFLLNLLKLKINIKNFFFTLSIIILAAVFISKDIKIPKIGSINKFSFKEKILEKNRDYDLGTAKYPNWLVAKSGIEIIYKAPIRIIYFTFSPFLWDIKKISHTLGMFDGLMYIYLVYLIYLNRKKILSDQVLKTIFLILLSYLIVYGISVGNFGTGLRHRSKFVILFILLAAPYLPKFIFSKKSKDL